MQQFNQLFIFIAPESQYWLTICTHIYNHCHLVRNLDTGGSGFLLAGPFSVRPMER